MVETVKASGLESLAAIANRHYGTAQDGYFRKPQACIAEYARLFADHRERPIALLELGVYAGQSLLIWREYFPLATIVGIDTNAAPYRIAMENVQFLRGSQDDPSILDRAGRISGEGFDIIIDDASHVGKLTRRSIDYLFPKWLKPGGIYVIEDLRASFYPDLVPDGARFEEAESDGPVFPSHQHGMLGALKQLVDRTVGIPGKPSALGIESITILWNMAVIRKVAR